jgi:hypothetical protein
MHNTTFLTCAVLGGGAITGIGSLPHTDPTAAVQLVAELCPEIPFWPQLPQRSRGELMVEQALTPFTDLLRPRTGRYGYQLTLCMPDARWVETHHGQWEGLTYKEVLARFPDEARE